MFNLVPTTFVVGYVHQARENDLESHRDGFDVLLAYYRLQGTNRQTPESALGFVVLGSSIDQTLNITDDGSGVEVNLQGHEVQTMGRY